MLSSNGHAQELPAQEKPFQIEQDDKFFSRLLSKETSMAAPSFRIYYGGVSVAVPFLWESQPGTPKHALSEPSLLPPLTPPPASSHYNFRGFQQSPSPASRSKLFNSLFLKISPKKPFHSPSNAVLSSSSSSSHSSFPSKTRGTKRLSSARPSFDNDDDDDEDAEEASIGSPTSTTLMCFGIGRGSGGGGGLRGGCSVVIVKKALRAMVGRGSGRG